MDSLSFHLGFWPLSFGYHGKIFDAFLTVVEPYLSEYGRSHLILKVNQSWAEFNWRIQMSGNLMV